MKTNRIFLAFLAFTLSFTACKKVPKSGKVKFQTEIDSVSYALGHIEANSFVKSIEQSPFEMDSIDKVRFARALAKSNINEKYTSLRTKQFGSLNKEFFYKGFLNQLAYGKSYFNERSADMYLRTVYNRKRAERDSIRKELANLNLKKGEDFLAQNAKKSGIVVTESGLQYKVLHKGTGKFAGKTDHVKCVYHGTLLDGTVFDSSKERGDTTTFGISQVIRGWTEALQIMPAGSEWRLYIPSNLAYGERGAGEEIGPNETLIFDINLVEVIEKEKK